MKTILVPTDFSESAYNAAHYAIGLASQLQASQIVLYHAYEMIIPVPDLPSSLPLFNLEELHASSMEGLTRMQTVLQPTLPATCSIRILAENELLAANIQRICEQVQADYIVMGITGGNPLDDILVGSNTVDVVKRAPVPVFVIPVNAKFARIEKVVFACDFKHAVRSVQWNLFVQVLEILQPELHVVHIGKEGKEFARTQEQQAWEERLMPFKPTYTHMNHAPIAEGITLFAAEKNASLLLLIPKKQGLFDGIFKRSTTARIAFKTNIPLLSIHE
jgi:nucleotide-binding universal stress UspA family protein